MSGTCKYKGNKKFLKPLISTGIKKKKIITSLWAVTKKLYSSGVTITAPVVVNENRIYIDIEDLITLAEILKIKYETAICLWLVANIKLNNLRKIWSYIFLGYEPNILNLDYFLTTL